MSRTRIHLRAFLSLCSIIVAISGFAQPGPPQTRGNERGQQFLYYEAFVFPGNDTSTVRIEILYRLDRAFLVPVKNQDPAVAGELVRRGEVFAELISKSGEAHGREVHDIVLGEQEPVPGEVQMHTWYEGTLTFAVPPGSYALRMQVDDLESKRSHVERDHVIEAPRFGGTPTSWSAVLYGIPGQDSLRWMPMNFGGGIQYGARTMAYLEGVSTRPLPASVRIRYTIAAMEEPPVEHPLLEDSVRIALRPGMTIEAHNDSGTISFTQTSTRRAGQFSAILPLPAERLPLRPLKIVINIAGDSLMGSVTTLTRIVWPDMPFSMRDVDYALASLRYITTGRVLDSLTSGDYETRRANLENFWRTKDMTPQSAYNEVMTQYYRRVDHALRAYSTLRQPDGARTDRGRIYVLYGPPTRTDRDLDPSSGFREVWVYEQHHKKFVFADDAKSGNYVLIATQSL